MLPSSMTGRAEDLFGYKDTESTTYAGDVTFSFQSEIKSQIIIINIFYFTNSLPNY